MLIEFNEIGVLTSANTESDILRQGTTSNVLTARFTTKNTDYTASFNFTRSDGKSISGVIMNIENSNDTDYKYKFSDEWFFAKSGETTLTIYLHNGSGDVVASGQYKFNIESTDYDDEPTIKISQYNEIVAELQNKVNKTDYAGHIENYNQLVDEVSKKAKQSDLELLQAELETSYRKKEEQDKIDKKKTNTYIVSCLRPEPTRDTYGKGWTLSDMDGNSFQTYDEFIEYVGDAIYSNGLLNSVDDTIRLYDGRNHYLVTEDYKIILITNRITDVLKAGDLVAVKEPNIPNRWCFGGLTLYKLGSIIDETSVANKDYVDTELSALKDKVFNVISTTYEEDIATDSYSVPSDFDGHSLIESVPCEVKSIKGNSVPWNQLFDYDNVRGNVSTVSVSGSKITATFSSAPSTNSGFYTDTVKSISGHYYLVRGYITLTEAGTVRLGIVGKNQDFSANTRTYFSFIQQAIGDYAFSFYIQGTPNWTGGGTMVAEDIVITDLTQLGKSYSNPLDFNKDYPLPYYEYNEGEIKSVKVSKIESWGYNLFDGELNINSNDSYQLDVTNLIRVVGGKTYSFETVNFSNYTGRYINEYDANGNFIKTNTFYKATYPADEQVQVKLTANTHFVKLSFYNSVSYVGNIPTNSQICFHLTGSLTGYKPYVGKIGTINLPNGKIDLNGFADTDIKDKLEFVEQENGTYNAIITRRVGVVDLGSLSWAYVSDVSCFRAATDISDIKQVSVNNILFNGICSKYKTTNYATLTLNNIKAIALQANQKRVWIQDRDLGTDPTAFKTAMSGIPLYYELEKPITEVIATGLTHEQVSMAFEKGGSIINDNENTEYNAQATTTIDFACKDWSI